MLDLFFPVIPKKKGKVVYQGVFAETNEVEEKRRRQREYERKYREKNRLAINARTSAYQKANPEKHRAANAKWQLLNREKYLETKLRYRMKNRELLAQKYRDYRKRKVAYMQPSPCGNEQKGVGVD